MPANTSLALSNAELYQRVALERERSYAILANIADGIVAVDRNGDVVLWNKAAEQITGVPAVLGAGTAADRRQRDLRRRSVRRAPDLDPARCRRVWLSLTEAVMRDPAGAVAGRIFAFRDVSGERRVEQMKSDFVSTVSHELRAPLTSIYGFAETLLRRGRALRGGGALHLSRLHRLGGAAPDAIVDTLLSVARLDAGDLKVELAPTDVGSLVSEVVLSAEQSGVNGTSSWSTFPRSNSQRLPTPRS